MACTPRAPGCAALFCDTMVYICAHSVIMLWQVVTCSGLYSQGSLRVVRNGIGLLQHSAAEMPGIR